MDNQNEVKIRDIPGWPGYQATFDGQIISYKSKEPKFLKPQKNKRGYLSINLYQNGKKNVKVHKLVALAFIGNRPINATINHRDGDKLNNCVTNLEYISQRENSTHYTLTQKTTSVYTGVYWHNKMRRWVAQIVINKKVYHLGCFKIENNAYNKYQTCLNAHNNGQPIAAFFAKRKSVRFTSKVKGITWNNFAKKWLVKPTINSQRIHIGYYQTEQEANIAFIKVFFCVFFMFYYSKI